MDLFSKVIMGHDVTLGTKILKGKPYGQ